TFAAGVLSDSFQQKPDPLLDFILIYHDNPPSFVFRISSMTCPKKDREPKARIISLSGLALLSAPRTASSTLLETRIGVPSGQKRFITAASSSGGSERARSGRGSVYTSFAKGPMRAAIFSYS